MSSPSAASLRSQPPPANRCHLAAPPRWVGVGVGGGEPKVYRFNYWLKGKPETGLCAAVIYLQLTIRSPYAAPIECCLSLLHLCTGASLRFAPLHRELLSVQPSLWASGPLILYLLRSVSPCQQIPLLGLPPPPAT